MTHFPVILTIGNETIRYSIPAASPGEALNVMRQKISISSPQDDFDGNYEVIYILNGRKKYALVFADNAREAQQKLKEKLGEVYKKITISSITAIDKNIGIEV
jgi:transcription termination factor NusB